MKKIATLLAVLALTACASTGENTQSSATQDSASKAIAAAEAALNKASSVGYEWRDSGKMLKQAQAAVEKKDFGTAQTLAEKAEMQGHLAFEQYNRYKDAYKNN